MIKSDIALICLGEGKLNLNRFNTEFQHPLAQDIKGSISFSKLVSGTTIIRTTWRNTTNYKVLEIINS